LKHETKRKPFEPFASPVSRIPKSRPHRPLPGQLSFRGDPVPAGKPAEKGSREPVTTEEWFARSATQVHPDRLELELRKLSEKTN